MGRGRKTKEDSQEYPIKETHQYGRYPQLEDDSVNSIMKLVLEEKMLTPQAFTILHKYIRKLENG